MIDRVAPGAVLSVASKAENHVSKTALSSSVLFHGQNYTGLANYIALFCPMTYHLDYSVTPDDVGIAGKWVKELTGKPVFTAYRFIRVKPPRRGAEARRLMKPGAA